MKQFSEKVEFIESTSNLISEVRSPISANSFTRELIAESSKKRTKISFVYKELLRSILNTFSNFSVVDDEDKIISVKCIHANPERAIAKLTQETNLILPILSVSQTKNQRDTKRQKYKPLISYEKYWDDKAQRALRVVSLADTPVDVEYELTVWSKYRNDLDQLTEQLYSIFNPDLEIKTIHSSIIKLFLLQETPDSDLVLADREDRVLKRSFVVVASTYIPNPKFLMTSTGKIEEFNYEVKITKRIE